MIETNRCVDIFRLFRSTKINCPFELLFLALVFIVEVCGSVEGDFRQYCENQ